MGIKSFQGARKQQQNVTEINAFRVSDFMSRNLITFQPEQTVEEVIQSLIKHKISGGPVVNANNELVGIISEGDCLKNISESRYHNLPMEQHTVATRMAKNVETIDGNMNVFEWPVNAETGEANKMMGTGTALSITEGTEFPETYIWTNGSGDCYQ